MIYYHTNSQSQNKCNFSTKVTTSSNLIMTIAVGNTILLSVCIIWNKETCLWMKFCEFLHAKLVVAFKLQLWTWETFTRWREISIVKLICTCSKDLNPLNKCCWNEKAAVCISWKEQKKSRNFNENVRFYFYLWN